MSWARAALRIAIGIQVTAHFPGIVHQGVHKVGFCVGEDSAAETIVAAIVCENIEARVGRFHPDGSDQPEACDIELPCRPNVAAKELDQAVLAAVKATHAPACPIPGMLPNPPGVVG